jgi:transcriptional regulator with XRE-family HTH domain
MKPKKAKARELGSKYFGRAIRAFRLSAGLSQQELAGRAGVSAHVVGMVEREKGRLSEQVLCGVCLGLESEAGRPMLKAVCDGAVAALWDELRSVELQMRKDRGWAIPEGVDEYSSAEEEFRRNLDSYIEAQRKLASQVFRLGLGVTSFPIGLELPTAVVARRRIRIRPKTRRKS